EFREYVLDAGEKVLLHRGKSVPIPPKVLELLLVLVENHGHVVEKDRLMEKLWADTYVEESNLTFSIRKLRKILGDDTHHPTFIETIPKRGYRFIAAVERTTNSLWPDRSADGAGLDEGIRLPDKEQPTQPIGVPARRRLLWVFIPLVLIGGAGLTYFLNGLAARKT